MTEFHPFHFQQRNIQTSFYLGSKGHFLIPFISQLHVNVWFCFCQADTLEYYRTVGFMSPVLIFFCLQMLPSTHEHRRRKQPLQRLSLASGRSLASEHTLYLSSPEGLSCQSLLFTMKNMSLIYEHSKLDVCSPKIIYQFITISSFNFSFFWEQGCKWMRGMRFEK